VDDSTDAEAIVASLSDAGEFGALFDRHATTIYRFLVRRIGPDHGDDILNDVFRIAFERRASYDSTRSNARPWLYGIATNLVARHRRSEARRLRATERLLAQHQAATAAIDDVTERLAASAQAPAVIAAVAALPAGERDVVVLTAWEDLSYDVRSGHTEAAIDLARLAGLPAVGLLAELVNDDGTVKRLPQLVEFAAEHGLKMISVADLIAYRQRREQLIERIGDYEVATEVGLARVVAYATPFDAVHHLALVFGELAGGEGVLVRIQREQVINDVFARRDGPGHLIPKALARLAAQGRGVLIYLREGTVGVPAGGLSEPAEANPEGAGATTELTRSQQWRDVGIGAQILRDLGVSSIRLLATRHRHYVGLAGFGIDIAATELIDG
jgi:3,4-dihydroxy 2-butanone 4-phosphate synthase/GTP cyclohydrolase II